GVGVRIATTSEGLDAGAMERLCALHRSLGVPDVDHVVRPVVRRGRAVTGGLGVDVTAADLPPELTITADGAFWSPFGPTVRGQRLDTDLLVTRTTRPLAIPAAAILRLVAGLPPGADTGLNIR
ncbi:MAG: Radical domain protein, partial [Chloroflexi bacterium]|nr:Radical domain protein [Chloroflexota bacterium]